MNIIASAAIDTAWNAFKSGEYDAAASTLRNALQVLPQEPALMVLLGKVRGTQGKLQEAVSLFQQAHALHPDDAEALSLLGWAYSGMKDDEKALEALRKAILTPNDTFERRLAAVRLHYMEKRYALALQSLNEAARLQRTDPGLHSLAALVFMNLKRYREAREAIGRAIAVTPFFVPDLYVLGQIEEKLGNYHAAMSAYDTAIQLSPNDERFYRSAACLALSRGRFRTFLQYVLRAPAPRAGWPGTGGQ